MQQNTIVFGASHAFQVTRIKVECSRDERFVQGGQSESDEVADWLKPSAR